MSQHDLRVNRAKMSMLIVGIVLYTLDFSHVGLSSKVHAAKRHFPVMKVDVSETWLTG
jgi:hypothetical protein